MAAHPEVGATWNTAPLTKFRPPRIRREVVARPALLQRLSTSIETCPVTLVCAPGGSGKTTLLAQWAQEHSAPSVPLWIAIDEDDNDRHRLFAALLRALEPLELAWEIPPATLLSHSAGSDSQCRAALAALVNALCTAAVPRIVLVLDDLHRVDRADVFELLESFIERLPDHVALVLGSRIEPPLPLARWRAHGELAEFIPWDLQFTEAEAAALAQSRLGVQPDPRTVREAIRRTHGWAAGLTLVLQSRTRLESRGPQAGAGDAVDRHLFAYMAQEILADLPADIRDFVLDCSILAELDPDLCQAVTKRPDSQAILESLYRRNLFLTATDDTISVLRFHDLFREFLQKQLEDLSPGRIQELHERAGRAERSLPRAIGHLLKAQCYDEAMELIGAHGEAMLAEGDHGVLERWLDQIPAEARAKLPRMGYLRGVCYWLRWDWPKAKRELEPTIALLDGPDQAALKTKAMFLLVDALNSSGEGAAAWSILEEIARHPLDDLSKAQLALQRAWCMLPGGNPEAVGHYLGEFITHAEKAPGIVCPATADRIHCLCIGLPGVADAFERFFTMSELVRGQTTAPWQLAALAVGAWAHFWRGRREPVERAIERGVTLNHQFGGMRLVSERALQFHALYLAGTAQYEQGEALMKKLIQALQTPEASAHRAVWQRAYQHGLARLYWLAGDHEQFRALASTLLSPRVSTEWPYIDTATDLVRGQLALLREDWAVAEAALEQAIASHRRFRMPMCYGDPRVSLAYLHLLREKRSKAWDTFEPVLKEVFEQQSVGLLLLEPKPVVNALLAIAPAEVRRSSEFHALTAKLALWNESASPAIVAAAEERSGPLSALSEREHEVLALAASGASNKHIARELSLSLHTVKRHIANVLDKLDCASRGQAADLYRRATS
jgi:LuxR family maltose regulon positive regulatory protein